MSDRATLYLARWRRLRRMDRERREIELEEIETWASGPGRRRDADRALTVSELRELASSGLFSIGAHSISHDPFPNCARERAAEISGSRRRCEEILDKPVLTFARAGFTLACSTVPGPVRRDSPRFALPRTEVRSWSGKELVRRLPRGW